MARILLVYGSKHGQTEKITNFISEELTQLGHHTDLFNCEEIPETISPQNYDATIIGAPVYVQGFPHALKSWVKTHAQHLTNKPSGFFSVCLGILQDDKAVQSEERQIVEKFFDGTNWHPQFWTIFAGSLTYSKYNWFLKRIMRSIAKKAGEGTDMTHDYEYTNWASVHQFTEDFVKSLNR